MSRLTEPCLLINCTQKYIQYRRGFARLLDVYNEGAEFELAEEPDNEEITMYTTPTSASTTINIHDFLLTL